MDKQQQFMESLYADTYKEIKNFEEARGKTKNEIYQLISYAIVTYGSKIKSVKAKKYIITSVLNMLTKDEKEVEEFVEKQLMINANKVCDFHGYKLTKKEKQKIVDKVYLGLTYKDRKKQNDENLNKKTHRVLLLLIGGKLIKDSNVINKLLDKEFKSYTNKVKSIVISETTRISNDLFLYKNKGKMVQYCSILEKNTCADCRDLDGEIFPAEEVYDLIPMHSNCKCYWTEVEDI